jgi:hypothetical protein
MVLVHSPQRLAPILAALVTSTLELKWKNRLENYWSDPCTTMIESHLKSSSFLVTKIRFLVSYFKKIVL